MDINQLIYFISVAQTLNFSEAARRNYVSQSTVSRYVIELEKELDVKLFTRSRRDVIITNEGKALLPYAIEIVENLNKAKTLIKQMHNGGQGKLTLGCDVTSVAFPARCIEHFSKKYPDITIDIRQLEVADRASAITDGDYDFCFMPRDMVPENSGIETVVTHHESLTVVVPKYHRFNKKSRISFCELADEKLLLLSESSAPIVYMEIMDLLHTFHISPAIDSVYNDLITLYISALSGLGVSVVPESVAKHTLNEHNHIISIEDADTSIAYVMAWSRDISNPAAKLFIQTVETLFEGEDNEYEL